MTIQQTLSEIKARADKARTWQYQEIAEEAKLLAIALEKAIEQRTEASFDAAGVCRTRAWNEARDEELTAILTSGQKGVMG